MVQLSYYITHACMLTIYHGTKEHACGKESRTFVPTKCSCSIAHTCMTHEHTHPLQSSPSPSHCSRHSARLRPYLLSCLQRLLLLHRQERPVRHSYCCPWQKAERSKAGTTAKTFIFASEAFEARNNDGQHSFRAVVMEW